MEKKLGLENIVLIGRTFDEYYRMFNLYNIDKEHEKICICGKDYDGH